MAVRRKKVDSNCVVISFLSQEWPPEQGRGLGTRGAVDTQINYSGFNVSSNIVL